MKLGLTDDEKWVLRNALEDYAECEDDAAADCKYQGDAIGVTALSERAELARSLIVKLEV